MTHTIPLPSSLKASFHRGQTHPHRYSLYKPTTREPYWTSSKPASPQEMAVANKHPHRAGERDRNREEIRLRGKRALSSNVKTLQTRDFHRLVSSSQYTLINISISATNIMWRWILTTRFLNYEQWQDVHKTIANNPRNSEKEKRNVAWFNGHRKESFHFTKKRFTWAWTGREKLQILKIIHWKKKKSQISLKDFSVAHH